MADNKKAREALLGEIEELRLRKKVEEELLRGEERFRIVGRHVAGLCLDYAAGWPHRLRKPAVSGVHGAPPCR